MDSYEKFSIDPSSELEKDLSHAEGATEVIDLSRLGLRQETERDIGPFAIICAGWNITNSWAGIAATLALAITQGGTVTSIYGLFLVLIAVGSCAATLAELASVYPTAGGQYHWVSILAPKKACRVLSYCCGSVSLFGWIALSAGITIIPPQLILAIVIFFDPTYAPKPWHYFILYQAFNLLILGYNIFALKRTPWIHNIGFALSIASFIAITVTSLARSTNKQTSDFVWTTFINQSGWSSDVVVFLTGMVGPNYMYAGIDGAIHLAEECSNAAIAVPRALMSTVCIGFITAFIFTISMIYSMSDFDAVLATPTGVPIYEIWYQASRSEAAATVFVILLFLGAVFALNASQQTSSRLTWSFARDDALVFSKYIGKIHPTLGVPVWALVANAFIIFIIGCVYLASTTAFNALIGSGLVLQQISFALPAMLVLYRRRSTEFLPTKRSFRLGPFGWVANVLTVAFGILVLVFYSFPIVLPATAGSMNYTSVVLGCIGLFATFNWFVHARKSYIGPRLDLTIIPTL